MRNCVCFDSSEATNALVLHSLDIGAGYDHIIIIIMCPAAVALTYYHDCPRYLTNDTVV